MQLKFNNRNTIRESIGKKLLKGVIIVVTIIFAIFLIEKINFPSPEKTIKKDITNEIIKLK